MKFTTFAPTDYVARTEGRRGRMTPLQGYGMTPLQGYGMTPLQGYRMTPLQGYRMTPCAE